MRRIVALLAATGALVAGCTSSGSPAPVTSTEVQTITKSVAPPPVPTPTPISTGPTTAADASSCPLVDEQHAADIIGMRLDRISVLKSAGKVIGCRFYGLQHPTAECPEVSCLAKEKLPPGNQPIIEILTTRYASAVDAHNAFILLAKKGANVQQAPITPGNVGLCYQTTFWSKDDGRDWACTYSVGPTMVVVRTVVTNESRTVSDFATAIAPKVG